MVGGSAFRAVWLASKVSGYLSILCLRFTPLDTRSRGITKSRSQVHEGGITKARGDQPPGSERASTRAAESTPVDELLELADDAAAAASSVELATVCILSSSLDVHCERLRRNWPASLYDWRMRFARDVLRQRLRTCCSCAHAITVRHRTLSTTTADMRGGLRVELYVVAISWRNKPQSTHYTAVVTRTRDAKACAQHIS